VLARPNDVIEEFARGEFPATLYLDGPSEALKAALLAELRRGFVAACPEAGLARVLRAAESSVEEVLAAYQGASLFTPRELIIVLDVEDLGRSEKKVGALAQGLRQPSGGSTLVLVESASDSPRKSLEPLRAACAVQVLALPPGRRDLLAWGTRRFGREQITVEPGVIEAIVDACEGDPLAFFSELEKLCTWASAAGTIGREEAAALLRPGVGAELPEYLAAVALGQPGLAAQRLGRVLAGGVGEGSVLFALANLVGGALGGWARYRDASETLRRRTGAQRLGRALDAIYRAEYTWKDGRGDIVALLEQVTREVASAS
jgi:DNA polymerase III delta subunit